MRRRTRSTNTRDGLVGSGFSTRQLTALVVTVLLAVVLVPVGAQAAQMVSAIITDPGGTNKANVDAGGHLQIGGEVTVGNQAGSPVPVSPQGTTMVEGSVAAQPALAGTSLADTLILDPAHGNTDSGKFFGQNFSSSETLALTSLTVDNFLGTAADVIIQALHPISGECGGNGGTAAEVGPPRSFTWGPCPRSTWTTRTRLSRRHPHQAASGACGWPRHRRTEAPWIPGKVRSCKGRVLGPGLCRVHQASSFMALPPKPAPSRPHVGVRASGCACSSGTCFRCLSHLL
jgi:hypothetical protein